MKIISCLAVIVLTGCVQSGQLDVGGQLKISPQNRAIAIVERRDVNGQCLYDQDYYLDTPIVISMVDSAGYAQGDTSVAVYVDYAENTYTGPPALSLFADRNANGVIDDPDELVSGFDHDIHRGKTSRYDAELMLLLRINLSCAFKGQVTAVSGPLVGSMVVELTARDDADTEELQSSVGVARPSDSSRQVKAVVTAVAIGA